MVARRGRLLAMFGFAFVITAVGVLVGRQSVEWFDETGGIIVNEVVLGIDPLVMRFAVPILVLFTAAGGIAEMIGDQTLVYVWLRSTRRSSIATASWAASAGTTLAITIPLALLVSLSFVLGAPGSTGARLGIVAWTTIAASLGTVAYAGLFVFLNTLTRFGSLIGAAYVLLWETTLSSVAVGARRLSVGHYAVALVSNRQDTANVSDSLSLGTTYPSDLTAVIVLICVTVAGVGLTSWRLQTMSVD